MDHQNNPATRVARNQPIPGIPKLELEMPVMLNKIILTKKLMSQLNMLQTGGGVHLDKPEYSNDDIVSGQTYLTDTILYIIEQLASRGIDEPRGKEDDLLVGLQWLHDILNDFKVPDELILQT